MARRKKRSDAAGGFLILLGAAVVTVIFLVRLAVTAAALLGPIALILIYIGSLRSRRAPLVHPPFAFDDSEDGRVLADLVEKRRAKLRFIRDQYAIGFANNLMLTAKSEEKLFHAGSRLGKELNSRLEEGFHAASILHDNIKRHRDGVLDRMPDWYGPIDQWARNKRLNAAAAIGIATAVATVAILDATDLLPSETASAMSAALLWNPMPDLLGGLYISATAVALLMAFASYAVLSSHYWQSVEPAYVDGWRALENKWQTPVEDEWHVSAASEPHAENTGYSSIYDETWHSVLRVDPDADIDDIRAAYRDLIRTYHPDLVAALGPRLREVAEEESKRINTAYAEAQAIRGFI